MMPGYLTEDKVAAVVSATGTFVAAVAAVLGHGESATAILSMTGALAIFLKAVWPSSVTATLHESLQSAAQRRTATSSRAVA